MKKILSYFAIIVMAITVSAFGNQAKAEDHTAPTLENLQYWIDQVDALYSLAVEYNVSSDIKKIILLEKGTLANAYAQAEVKMDSDPEAATKTISNAIGEVTTLLTMSTSTIEEALKAEAPDQFNALGGESPSEEVQAIINAALEQINALHIDLINKSVNDNLNEITAAVESIYNQAESDVKAQQELENKDTAALEELKQKFEDLRDSISNGAFDEYIPEYWANTLLDIRL